MHRFMAAANCALFLCSVAAFAQDETYAEKLGWPKGSKVVIFHSDDLGMSYSSNAGTIEAFEKGVLTSASAMMPCPWIPHWNHYLKNHPDIDNGLHLTLTSEWTDYRWAPLAGAARVPGLTDGEGCLPDNVGLVVENATADEIEMEIRAQISRAEKMGMTITHIDSHMGTLFADKDFFERYVKVGVEKQIPILIAGGHLQFASVEDAEAVALLAGVAKEVWAAGLPVLDDVHTATYGWKDAALKKTNMIRDLKAMQPGVMEVILHCTRPSDVFEKIADSGPTRLADLELMLDDDVRQVIEEEGIILTTWRELKLRRDNVK